MSPKIETSILINASPSEVWKYLTTPALMQQWMGEPEMNIEVTTDWKIGGHFKVRGFHHVRFENRGTVLQFEPMKILQHSHLSSVSHLPDKEENYSIITFLMSPSEQETLLTIQTENFPTESIYRHFKFYWEGTVNVLKALIERGQ